MSEGQHFRHSAVNDVISHAFTSAKIPSLLEPSGLDRSDGKQPDGVTMVPWKSGSLWSGMRHLSPILSGYSNQQYRGCSCCCRGEKAGEVCQPQPGVFLYPSSIETLGAIGPKSLAFLKDLGRGIFQQSGESKATPYLLQRTYIRCRTARKLSGHYGYFRLLVLCVCPLFTYPFPRVEWRSAVSVCVLSLPPPPGLSDLMARPPTDVEVLMTTKAIRPEP